MKTKSVLKKRVLKRGKKGRRGSESLSNIMVGLAVILATALIAILITGVLHAQISKLFVELNVTSSWTNLANTASNYIQTTFSLVLIGLMLLGFAIILGVVKRFGEAT